MDDNNKEDNIGYMPLVCYADNDFPIFQIIQSYNFTMYHPHTKWIIQAHYTLILLWEFDGINLYQQDDHRGIWGVTHVREINNIRHRLFCRTLLSLIGFKHVTGKPQSHQKSAESGRTGAGAAERAADSVSTTPLSGTNHCALTPATHPHQLNTHHYPVRGTTDTCITL